MAVTTGLSGNEIYCLKQKGFDPGNIVVGNSVYSLGFIGGIGSGLKSLTGGEIQSITQLIEEGREAAFKRLQAEAQKHNATGVTGVTSELIMHGGNIEFLSIGSLVHTENQTKQPIFTTSSDGQELYAQLDAGYKPICFAFGNVAYAMGVGRGILGGLKTLARGEIREYSDMFNHTRHLALQRIIQHAKENKANAVLGIKTSISPFMGAQEMLMIGTASHHDSLIFDGVITSDMTNVEMWNMASMGYAPMKLLLGASVYSLGMIGGISAALKSYVRGELTELTTLIYDARENALDIINREAKSIGADDVVGVKTYIYQIGNGMIEFLAIGTAVKKMSEVKTASPQLPPQVFIADKDTFYDVALPEMQSVQGTSGLSSTSSMLGSIVSFIVVIIVAAAMIWFKSQS